MSAATGLWFLDWQIVPAPDLSGHGYGMKPGGFAPGYCWCGQPAYDGFAGHRGCDALAELVGQRATSHREAERLAEVALGRWDDGDVWRRPEVGS